MIIAGFGYRRHVREDALQALFDRVQRQVAPITGLAAPADKIERVQALAERLGIPVYAVVPEKLHATDTPTVSGHSVHARGVGSVAEAAALAAAGQGASLLCTRIISSDRMATCAVARGDTL